MKFQANCPNLKVFYQRSPGNFSQVMIREGSKRYLLVALVGENISVLKYFLQYKMIVDSLCSKA